MKLAEHKSQNFCSKSEIEAENELIRLRRKLYNKMIKTIKPTLLSRHSNLVS